MSVCACCVVDPIFLSDVKSNCAPVLSSCMTHGLGRKNLCLFAKCGARGPARGFQPNTLDADTVRRTKRKATAGRRRREERGDIEEEEEEKGDSYIYSPSHATVCLV